MSADIGIIITAATLLINYIDTTVAYTDEARALYANIRWDLKIVKSVADHLQTRIKDAGSSPPEELTRLLSETSDYLKILMEKATASFLKLQASGFWRRTANQGLYFWRRNELKQVQNELHQWTQRFEVRLLGLPSELRTIVPAASGHEDGTPGTVTPTAARPLLQSNKRLQQFVALTPDDKRQLIEKLCCASLPEVLQHRIDFGDGSGPAAFEVDSKQFILTSRLLPPSINPGTREFDKYLFDLGELSAALHCLEPNLGIGLLQVEYYFYDLTTKEFLFVQVPPFQVGDITTLDNMIDKVPYSRRIGNSYLSSQFPLEWRLNLAKKLAEAVFFLHTAGFVHKNITLSSIAVIQQSDAEPSPGPMGEPYLMGFDMIRSDNGLTLLEGGQTPSSHLDQDTVAMRNLRVYHHPDRLQGENVKRYIKTYDVYSLGVVLLQIGLWEPIVTTTRKLQSDCNQWPEELCKISMQLVLTMGSRYQRVVSWCLGLKGNYVIRDTEFVQEVLDPLDDMSNAMS